MHMGILIKETLAACDRQSGFFLAGDCLKFETCFPFDPGEEVVPVEGLAAGLCCDTACHINLVLPQLRGAHAERVDGSAHCRFRQAA